MSIKGPKIPNIPTSKGTIFPLIPSIPYIPNMPSDPLTLYPINPPDFPQIPMSFMDKFRKFLKSDFYFFMTYYLKFIIIFSICFYILLNISSKTDSIIIKIESKIFFYILLCFLFLIINDILETPLEGLFKFFLIIIATIILAYIINYIITYYYNNDHFIQKLLVIIGTTLAIYIIGLIIIKLVFKKKDISDIYNTFNFSIIKNSKFLTFTIIFLFIFKMSFETYNQNNQLAQIINPTVLGGLLMLYLFIFIIYLCVRLKIINRVQYLNTFIVLSSIFVFLFFISLHVFMQTLSTVCTTGQTQESVVEQEVVSLLIIGGVLILLWLVDTRNWHQIGSILFLIITLFAFFCFFYYGTKYPSTGLLSLWLFIEWLIVISYKKENSKNAIHFAFMTT